eukprot:COSAG04_NODE_8482_length_968_cov_1.182969_1_plen_80_part_10
MVLVPVALCVGIAWDCLKRKTHGDGQEAAPPAQSLDAQLENKEPDVHSPRRQMISKALLNKMLVFVFLICAFCRDRKTLL